MSRALLLLALLCAPLSAHAYAFSVTSGCPAGRGAAWPARSLPSTWLLNTANFSGLSAADTQAAMAAAAGIWERPVSCCSGFRATYGGATNRTADGSLDGVISASGAGWDGDANTIAVTAFSFMSCELLGAEMEFNSRDFTFRVDGSTTDLQSIAAHEFGHWLGLGHSSTGPGVPTMNRFYSNGVEERDLSPDDEAGVCALYPTANCGLCDDITDCPVGQVCNAARCEVVACTSDPQCPAGSYCGSGGVCRPGCQANTECDAGEVCEAGRCRAPRTGCNVCEPCTTDAECGDESWGCIDAPDGTGLGATCTRLCESDYDCPGDSICYGFSTPEGDVGLCYAPSAGTAGLCGQDYVCAPTLPGCQGIWSPCDGDTSACPSYDTDFCATWGRDQVCTCLCRTDEDCGPDNQCVIDGTTLGACVPRDVIDPCWDVTCPPAEECVEGECRSVCGFCPRGSTCNAEQRRCIPDDPCAGVQCGPFQGCVDGECVDQDPCLGVGCEPGTICNNGDCVPVDPCAGVTCTAPAFCVDGQCVTVDPCAGVNCAAGEVCEAGTCRAERPRATPSEPNCGAASGVTGLALLAVLAVLHRRR